MDAGTLPRSELLELGRWQRCCVASVVLSAESPEPLRTHAAEQWLHGRTTDEPSAAPDGATPCATTRTSCC
ncbi:MAG TPA: hypothetical protein PKC59_11725 [Burkholderiaceae bacterium]|nr:hypothetical protein [Burkholderiaceae bacterium]HMX10603.1 hypothetical protein [Burkholderiaceae bacterium]HMZ00518.1 hypothetical protein [Burkholderiaceae bacterium]HNB44508.1 hypothetical protein [Burkholderiaceae bacterium]HNG80271.1 hypothetical protein [Burkholderiaceae bacterium]